MLRATSKSFRLHIGFFGRRNVGKSSLLNAITKQHVSIVSEIAGTTTDPVEKPMELMPIGPVLFVDTAGVDDVGALGRQRTEKTRLAIARTDVGVLVTEAGVWGAFEEQLLAELRSHGIPVLLALNKADLNQPTPEQLVRFAQEKFAFVQLVATTGEGVDEFRSKLWEIAPAEAAESPVVIRDLVGPSELAVLVMPIDKEAPKGRIKQLQAQAIRDLLDGEASCIVVKDSGLKSALDNLKTPPSIVVTDAQVFEQVARSTPDHIPLTAFSILLSRLKGDLVAQTTATLAVASLKPGDGVLVAESCTHHPIEEDIGRVKIPRWLQQSVGGDLVFTHVKGRDFPKDLSPYKLVVHCGACMWNRQEMVSRIRECHRQGIPITNYGLVIAYALGILERALEPFPEALSAYLAARAKRGLDAAELTGNESENNLALVS
ncbi:MAG TPA: [FeFe] hydrogenase H-cluster maturation GTPase HydF [Terracidiphilus sp.]|jgi:[FeFe] hydrogenase H-cluster maturation GTPase HydF